MSVLEQIGMSEQDRVVVIHVDDVGMSPAANSGALVALEAAATCGSIMVPCPGFEEAAKLARDRPDLDLGVHLTLNAEYESYRWGPVHDDVPSLVSPDGGMWRTTAETVEHATAEDVERELRAQIDTALEAGVDATHIDSHMGTVFDVKFAEIYFKLALDYRLPAFVPRVNRDNLPDNLKEMLADYLDMIDKYESSGMPVFDYFDANSLSFEPGTGVKHNAARLEGLGAGLSYLITHCALGNQELQSITHDWRQRDEERKIYSDGSMAAVLETGGVKPIGMRELRDSL
ncbi:MAG: ChbG/HpnK family deacetylase [bacterium]|nr:ChbG/HpnK family deacetylase [bacterium]